MDTNQVQVGVGIIIVRDGRVLLGERQGSHGSGTWALPGGHLEFGESVADCAKREVFEETGLEIHDVRSVAFTNDIFEENQKHYVTLFVMAVQWRGEPKVMEPQKCKGWEWCEWDNLPNPLFTPLRTLKREGFELLKEI